MREGGGRVPRGIRDPAYPLSGREGEMEGEMEERSRAAQPGKFQDHLPAEPTLPKAPRGGRGTRRRGSREQGVRHGSEGNTAGPHHLP